MELDPLYTRYRPLLFSIAYRLLGSVADAEDAVQEAFLARKERSESAPVENEKAFLCRVVANKCADRIRSAQRARETYVGPWLPEPLVEGSDTPEDASARRESLHTAYLLLLQQLGAVERTVLVLREAFAFPYTEIAEIVGTNATNCRQLLHRAKRRLSQLDERGAFLDSRPATDSRRHARIHRLAEQFARSIENGEIDRAVALLSPDAKLIADGGGLVKTAPIPVVSPRRIAGFLIGVGSRLPSGYSFEMRTVNGLPGWVGRLHGTISFVLSLGVDDERITDLFMVVNPEKLLHLKDA